nr:unnamed protein product [Callosobruchus analis]
MTPTNKSSVDVVDKNKCITCAKKLSRSSKVATCSVCEISVHIECANYEGDASSYKCENCKINSSDASIETVIDKQNGSENNDILSARSVIQEISNKRPEKIGPARIKDNKMLIEDREIIANRFNQHFVDLPKNILGKIPQIQYRDSIRRNSNTMFLFPFDGNITMF